MSAISNMSEGSQTGFQTANPRNDHEHYFSDVSVKHEGKTFELSEGFGVKYGGKDMVVGWHLLQRQCFENHGNGIEGINILGLVTQLLLFL